MERVAFYTRKGGTGKTFLSYNTAFGLSKMGKKVCLIDLDSQRDSSKALGLFFDNKNKDYIGIEEVFNENNDISIKDCLIEARENLYVISNRNLEKLETVLNNVRAEKIFQSKIEPLKELGFDYIIYDCSPSSISKINDSALCNTDSLVIPVQLKSEAVSAAADVSNYLGRIYLSPKLIKCVVPNMFKNNKQSPMNLQIINKIFDKEIITEPIKDRAKYSDASTCGKSIFEHDANISLEFMEIFKKVVTLIG